MYIKLHFQIKLTNSLDMSVQKKKKFYLVFMSKFNSVEPKEVAIAKRSIYVVRTVHWSKKKNVYATSTRSNEKIQLEFLKSNRKIKPSAHFNSNAQLLQKMWVKIWKTWGDLEEDIRTFVCGFVGPSGLYYFIGWIGNLVGHSQILCLPILNQILRKFKCQ